MTYYIVVYIYEWKSKKQCNLPDTIEVAVVKMVWIMKVNGFRKKHDEWKTEKQKLSMFPVLSLVCCFSYVAQKLEIQNTVINECKVENIELVVFCVS